jgi:hypothetical protein
MEIKKYYIEKDINLYPSQHETKKFYIAHNNFLVLMLLIFMQ